MKKLITLLLVLVAFNANSQNKKWTLKECVEYAIENNISVQQSELDLDLASINKNDAIGNYLPSINANGSHSWNVGLNQDITTGILGNATTQFTSVGASVGIDLYGGLQNLNKLHKANLAILASQYQLDNMKDDISVLVANSFLQILFNKEQLKVFQAQLDISKQDLERTHNLVDAGALPKGDLLEIQATIATQEQQIVNSENAIVLSKVNLAQTLLIEDYGNFDISDTGYEVPPSSVLDQSPEAIIEKAKEVRYAIKIAENNAEMAVYDLKIARGAYHPTLRGAYSYDTRASYSDIITGFEPDLANPTSPIGFVEGSGDVVVEPNFNPITSGPKSIDDQFSINDGHNFGLSLNIPIFNGFAARNNVKRNKVNVERTKIQLEQTKLDLETQVYQAYNDTKGALKAYEAAQKSLEARQLAFEYSKERYDVGLLNAFDFSQSQNTFEAAQSEVIRTKYDYIFKLKVLEFYFGIPIVDIN